MTAADMQRDFGRVVLFIGVEAQHWTVATFTAAAKAAKALGIDTLCPKRADGSIRWYGSPDELAAEYKAVEAEGVKYVPFGYCYGPKFGNQQIHDECAVLEEMARECGGLVVADMETEWDNQLAAARLFESIMRPVPCVLGVTTWADPAYMGWLGVAQAIAPCVNVWIPQQYNSWLAAQPVPAEETIVQPGIDLSNEFGANDVVAIARAAASRRESVWVWEYTYAQRYSSLMLEIARIMHAGPPALVAEGNTAALAITPDTGFDHAVITTDSTSLGQLAARAGLSNWYQELYKPNMEAIEAGARAAGNPAGSSGGTVIVPGVKLNYNGGHQ